MKKATIIIFVLITSLLLTGCFSKQEENQSNETNNSNLAEIEVGDSSQSEEVINKEQELKIEDLKIGDGKETKVEDTLSVHYTGTLEDGTKFDSSYDRDTPFEFVLGTNQVIKGWDIGLIGMKAGGKRKLTIPPELGYGSRAVGSIPANSTLVFEIELLEVK